MLNTKSTDSLVLNVYFIKPVKDIIFYSICLLLLPSFFFFDTLQLLLPTSDERKKLYQGTDAQN